MKRVLCLAAVAVAMVGCSSTPKTADVQAQQPQARVSDERYEARADMEQQRRDRVADRAISQAPEWMTKLPKSDSAVYANATAVSPDMGMADEKAKTLAFGKICMAAGGEVDKSSRVFRADNGDISTETSELAVRSLCRRIDITGAEIVEIKRIGENGKFRSYVLVALPMGDSNTIAKTKLNAELARKAVTRSNEAFQDLDRKAGEPAPAELKPQSKVETIDLLPVDNEAYKKRRDEALAKPGAVIGRTTVE